MGLHFPVYLFDVDGTLTDSAPDITGSVLEVLDRNGYPAQPVSLLRTYIGRHLIHLFEDIIPGIDAAGIDDLIERYRVVYAARGHVRTRTCDGVAEMPSALPEAQRNSHDKGYAYHARRIGEGRAARLF